MSVMSLYFLACNFWIFWVEGSKRAEVRLNRLQRWQKYCLTDTVVFFSFESNQSCAKVNFVISQNKNNDIQRANIILLSPCHGTEGKNIPKFEIILIQSILIFFSSPTLINQSIALPMLIAFI